MNISDEAIEAAVIAHGRASNPKWDHPIFGYETFSEDQKEHLRDQARTYLEAAAPLITYRAAQDAYEQGWGAGFRHHKAATS